MARHPAIAVLTAFVWSVPAAGQVTAVTDGTTFNVGTDVQLRVEGAARELTADIRYAGEQKPLASGIRVRAGQGFSPLWTVPWDARTGRYEVDVSGVRGATSFAVHRKLVQIMRLEMARTFYTNGDPIDCRVTVRNLSNLALRGLQVEFAPAHFPWIAPAPDEPAIHPAIVAKDLSLAAGESRILVGSRVAVANGGDKPAVTGYVATVRDEARRELYDVAFSEPVLLRPPNTDYPKHYPFSYLYSTLAEVEQHATVYRQFYPPELVSDSIAFDSSHTIFPSGAHASVRFTIHPGDTDEWAGAAMRTAVLDAHGTELRSERQPLPLSGEQQIDVAPLPDGLYAFEVSVISRSGDAIARNRIEFAFNEMPKSILVFCAHEDDDTAHPELIRAAVENRIPIHFVYFTNGDAGGCDRYYRQTCDAARAMDFGETRVAEAKASLAHLGVPPENLFFLGLPDGGLEEIWLHHADAGEAYSSVLLATDHAPYRGIVQPNLPFARDPIVAVAKSLIRQFRPDVIVTGHPEERHVDHRANNWLVVKAMRELLAEGAIDRGTRLLVDKSYGETSWIHSPYRYAPFQFFVTGEVARRSQEALWFYQSQDGNRQQARLIPYRELKREPVYPHLWLLDWSSHAGWNERDLTVPAK